MNWQEAENEAAKELSWREQMNDKELLTLAAKAAGIELTYVPQNTREWADFRNEHGGETPWNPLTDDGDALRLAVKLGIGKYFCIEITGSYTQADFVDNFESGAGYEHKDDPCAATRRAIVKAAAEICRSME